jgi:hypothetical protein
LYPHSRLSGGTHTSRRDTIAEFRLHAGFADGNPFHGGPSFADVAGAQGTFRNGLVITWLGGTEIDVDFYTPAGVVVDSGVLSLPEDPGRSHPGRSDVASSARFSGRPTFSILLRMPLSRPDTCRAARTNSLRGSDIGDHNQHTRSESCRVGAM